MHRGQGAGLSLEIVYVFFAIMALFIPLMLEVSVSLQQLATNSVAVTMIPLGTGYQTQQEKALAWLLPRDPIIYPVTVDLVQ